MIRTNDTPQRKSYFNQLNANNTRHQSLQSFMEIMLNAFHFSIDNIGRTHKGLNKNIHTIYRSAYDTDK